MATIEIHEPEVKEKREGIRLSAAVIPRGEIVGPPFVPRPMFADSILEFGVQRKRKALATTFSFMLNCLVIGGLLGIPIAVGILQHADPQSFRVGFGAVLAIYATYALCRPTLTYLRRVNSWGRHALIGFGGGLIGGLTAMPGAVPTIWCDMHGMPKNEQRGLVQPFIAVMQVFALSLMLSRHSLSSKFLIDFAISLPALAAGAALGIVMFRHVNETAFRRIVLIVLLLSGLSLVI